MDEVLRIVGGVALGALLGFVGGILGIGGGLFAIPILGVFYGLDEQHAQGTSMLMVVPNVLFALYRYVRRGDLDRRMAIVLGASAVPLTYFGAMLAVRVSSQGLRRGFACFLFGLACWFAVRARANAAPPTRVARTDSWLWTVPIGAVGGGVSGLFSVGGAVFAVPILAFAYGLGQASAQGLGLALVAPGTLVALVTYAVAGDVVWKIGIPLAVGGVLFVGRGVEIAHRLPERALRLLFAGALAISGSVLLARASS